MSEKTLRKSWNWEKNENCPHATLASGISDFGEHNERVTLHYDCELSKEPCCHQGHYDCCTFYNHFKKLED